MFKKVLFLFIIFILIISCKRAVTRPNLDSLGKPPEDPNTPIIDENPNTTPEQKPEEELIIKATDTEEIIKTKIQKYYEKNKKYVALVEDSEEYIKANKTMEKINSAINSVSFSQGVSLNLISTDITEIEDNAFKNNANLISVELPNTLTSIGIDAFNGCKNLVEINFPSALINIGASAFFSCKSLQEADLSYTKLTELSGQTFYDCGKLEKVLLPNNLSKIQHSVFAYCYSLKEINFPKSLSIIGAFSFTECGVERLILNEGLSSIDNMVFYKCKSLKQISLPSTLTKIGNSTFTGCTSLFDIEYNGNNMSSVQATDIFKAYADAKESTPQALYLPNVEDPASSQDPNSWDNFLGYNWANKINYKKSMPAN